MSGSSMGLPPEPIETVVAAQANTLGWQSVSDLIDEQTLRASWQECREWLMKVACKLDNPLPLLESLANAGKDDLFRHRLCLAAHCAVSALAANSHKGTSPAAEQAKLHRQKAQAIVEEIFSLWWDTEDLRLFAHFQVTLSVIAEIDSGSIMSRLVETLRSSEYGEAEKAAQALRAMAETENFERTVVTPLIRLLSDPEWSTNSFAACTLVRLGGTGARKLEVAQKLSQQLDDPDFRRRAGAANLLGEMGEAAARHAPVLERLTRCLQDPDLLVCDMAAAALAKMGKAAAERPGTVERLLENLSGGRASKSLNGFGIREGAASTLEGLGETVQHPGVVSVLDRGLDEALRTLERGDRDKWSERSSLAYEAACDVIRALGAMGARAAKHPGVVEHLVQCLRAWQEYPRFVRAAIEAFGRLGESAASQPGLVLSLVEMLREPFPYVADNAAEALRALGDAAARQPGVLESLQDCLGDSEIRVRISAAKALGGMGKEAARHPGVVEQLLEGLRDWGGGVCACSLGEIGPAALRPQVIVNELLCCLSDPGWFSGSPVETPKRPPTHARWSALAALGMLAGVAEVRSVPVDQVLEHARGPRGYYGAIHALGALGEPAALQPGVLEELARCLSEPRSRHAAIEALGKMGKSAAQNVAVVERLLECLQDRELHVRRAAAEALQSMMLQGARFYRGAQGTLEIR